MILRNGHLYGAATTGALLEAELFSSSRRGKDSGISKRFIPSRAQADGSFPYGALLFDASGNIFGTTYYGGANNIGSVYELSRRAYRRMGREGTL